MSSVIFKKEIERERKIKEKEKINIEENLWG